MAQSFTNQLPSAIIANGATISNVFIKAEYEDAVSIFIYSPAVLAEAVTIQVSDDPTGNGTFVTWQDDSAVDVPSPGAGKGRGYFELAAVGAFRLVAGSAVGGQRTFKLTKSWTI